MPRTREDHDSPWKEALALFFRPFLQLLYPDIHRIIDWSHVPVFLDKELQKLTRAGKAGRRHADKLAQVWLRSGCECWLLIHVEVQGGEEKVFQERMFTYYTRIRDHYQKPVRSLAVLTDANPHYRPERFEDVEADDYGVRFRFRTVKLLDFQPRLDELLASDNPFALLVAAQLTAKLVKDGHKRVDNLIGFYRLASRKRIGRDRLARLLVFLEWLVALPPRVEAYYNAEVDRFREESTVPYVSIMERRWTRQGMEQGLEKGLGQGRVEGQLAVLTRQLARRFGPLDAATTERLQQASSTDLERWTDNILDASTLEEVFGED